MSTTLPAAVRTPPEGRLVARLAARAAAWPWWAKVLAVYLGTRAVSAVILGVVARSQAENLWTSASPSYADFTGLMWDSDWYRQIAEDGYPTELPLGADGRVQQNALAFFPLFPSLARLVMGITGLPWHVAAPTVALVLGTAAALVVHQVMAEAVAMPTWLDDRARAGAPLVTVALLGLWGATTVLQVAYTESLALLLLATALLLLIRREYASAIPVVVGLGLTRAVAMPFAVAVVAHGVTRWGEERRGGGDFAVRDRVAVGLLAVTSVAAGLLWPIVAGLLAGRPDAYTLTQGAWRGRGSVVPVLPWVDVARWWAPGWWVLLLGAVLVLAVGAVLAVRPFGAELTGWIAGYFAYLLAVIEPGTSVLRFLLLAFPVAGAAAVWVLRVRRRTLALTVLLLVGMATQVAWVWCIWRLTPPTGWPP